MDSLIKQMSVRFSKVGKANHEESSRRIPLQKTQSFKGEKKRAQNWLRRQFSRQTSGEFDLNTQMEHATAVAAAAYAINKSLEERKAGGVPPQLPFNRVKSKKEAISMSNISEQKKTSDGPEPSMSRQKSKKEETPIPITEPGGVSKKFSGEIEPITAAKDEKSPEDSIHPPPIKKTPTFTDELSKKSTVTTKPKRTPSKVTDPSPSSMKKTPTCADEDLNRGNSKKPEGGMSKIDLSPTKPDIHSPIKPATPPTETKRQSSTGPGTTETQADAWEKAEMAKIKERYEKLNKTILSWEERKKKKSRRKFDKAERELEKRRIKALQKYRGDMETIDQIAGGARAQAQDKRRNEELKAKEKADIIRTTRKVPATTCFCF